MVYRLFSTDFLLTRPWEQISMKFKSKYMNIFIQENEFENVVFKMVTICLGLDVYREDCGLSKPCPNNMGWCVVNIFRNTW